MWGGETSRCDACGIEIGWGKTRNKKWVPFEIFELGYTVHIGKCSKLKLLQEIIKEKKLCREKKTALKSGDLLEIDLYMENNKL